MHTRKRLTTWAVAVLSLLMIVSTQAVGTAAADESYGEYTVGGRILDAYKATGGPDKWGNPTMNEAAAAFGGRFQRFEKDTSFYWKASVSGGTAHQIGGAIRFRWGQYNFERGPLGFPVTDELDAAGKGRKQFFEGGNMYYGAATGTHPVWGQILNKYAAAGGPGGRLGLPVGDEYRQGPNGSRYAQDFQGGRLIWP